jgi:hypothetical protein
VTQDRFNLLVKVAIVAAIAFIVSPIIFMVVKGIIGVVLALAIAGIAYALSPAFASWLTALKFKSLNYVISRAPVEELIQRAKERWDALNEQMELLKEQAATLAVYKKRALKTAAEFPEEAKELNDNLAQYEQLFAYRVTAFQDAKNETIKFSRTVDKAESMYQMAVADAALGKSFGKNKDFMAVFREKTAFDAIDKASAQSLANLKMALVDNDYGTKIDAPAHAIKYDEHNNVVLGNILSTAQPVTRGIA